MLFFLLLFTCIVLIIFLFINNDYWKKRNVVQYNGLLPEFVFGNRSLAEVYKDIYDKHPDEPYVGFFIGNRPALLIRDVENIQEILAGDNQDFHPRGIISNPDDKLSNNVFFMDDYFHWKIIRKKISPVFTSAKLKNIFYILDRCARDLVESIEENPQSVEKPFDALYTYTTASITASILGIDAQVKNSMDSPFLDTAKKAGQPSLRARLIFASGNITPHLLTAFNLKRFGAHEFFFVDVVKNVIDNRRNNKEKRNDFIDMCLELQDQGTMKDFTTNFELESKVELLAAQAFFFFLSGADISASTLHFVLLELSNNPTILKRVHDEIDKIFQGCNENLTFNDINKLQYLEMVVKEAMRKYPPIGLIQRKCARDTKLPVGRVKLEKDCVLVIPVYGIHRDKVHYPNPEVFDPERFSPENIIKIPKFTYLPFGEGNRICLGMRFVRVQAKTCLAWLLRRYTLRPQSVTPERLEPHVFSLRASHIRYDLIPRNRTF